MEIPYSGRATINEDFNGVEIIIPTKKNWFIILFFGFWLCGWAFGEFSVPGSFFGASKGVDLFAIVWLAGWTAGGFFAFRIFWWTLMGKEMISISHNVLNIDKKGAIFYRSKAYDLNEAKNFRVQEDYSYPGPFGQYRSNFFAFNKSGTIRFDYGMETVKFGEALDEAEANYILEKLRYKKLIS